MLDTVATGRRPLPPKLLLYGTAGIGKTTIAADAPNPIFAFTEESQGELDLPRFEPGGPGQVLFRRWADLIGAIGELYTDEHDRKFLVIDTIDFAEPLARQAVIDEHGEESFGRNAFGSGVNFMVEKFRMLLAGLDALNQDKGMGIILLSHAGIQRFSEPGKDEYDRYFPRMHNKLSALVTEWAQTVLFATSEVTVSEKKGDFGKTKTIATGQGRRILLTEERPSQVAKNRCRMPYKLRLPVPAEGQAPEGSWQVIQDALSRPSN